MHFRLLACLLVWTNQPTNRPNHARTHARTHARGGDGRPGELFADAEREQREMGPQSKLHLIILDEVGG